MDAFIGCRCGFKLREFRVCGKRVLSYFVLAMKEFEVASVAGLDGLLDAMVARDEDCVRPTHQGTSIDFAVILQMQNGSSSNCPFNLFNARFLTTPCFSHELQDAFMERFLIHVLQTVAEKRQRFLLCDRGGEGGVDEAVERDALLFG